MKQTNLHILMSPANETCLSKLACVWGLYGAGMYLLWEAAGTDGLAQMVVWGVALAIGAALAMRLWEERA